jgi:carboxylesterase type B
MFFHQTNSPVYLFSFDYLAPGAIPRVNPQLRGVGHGWELQYLFGIPGTQFGGWKLTIDDTLTENVMGQYWTDFIKTGYAHIMYLSTYRVAQQKL